MHRLAVRAARALSFVVLVAACAPVLPVSPARLGPLSAPAPDLVLAADLPILLRTGYTRTLPAGTRWRAVGTLPEGVVYRPVGTVFSVEGRNVHEAWLVVRGAALQGFYLPGEENFSATSSPLPLPVSKGAPR